MPRTVTRSGGENIVDLFRNIHGGFKARSAADEFEEVRQHINQLIEVGDFGQAFEQLARQRHELSRTHGRQAANEAVAATGQFIRDTAMQRQVFEGQPRQEVSNIGLGFLQPGADISQVAERESNVLLRGTQNLKAREQAITERELRGPRVAAEEALGGQRRQEQRNLAQKFREGGTRRRLARSQTAENLASARRQGAGGGDAFTANQAAIRYETIRGKIQETLDRQQSLEGGGTAETVAPGVEAAILGLNEMGRTLREAGMPGFPDVETQLVGPEGAKRVILAPVAQQGAAGQQGFTPEVNQLIAQVGQNIGAGGQAQQAQAPAIPAGTAGAQQIQPPPAQGGGGFVSNLLGSLGGAVQGAIQQGGAGQAPQGGQVHAGQQAAPTPQAPQLQQQAPQQIAPPQAPQIQQQSVVPEFPPAVAQQIMAAQQAGQPIAKSQVRAALLAQGITDQMQQNQLLQQIPWGQ
jgi:hypothetical protein